MVYGVLISLRNFVSAESCHVRCNVQENADLMDGCFRACWMERPLLS